MISVCVLTRRRSERLGRCLDSLRSQDFSKPWELVVCSDGDRLVPGQVRSKFPSAVIGIIDKRGAPPGQARNLLVDQASGDLLLFLDDDVLARPDLLSRLDELSGKLPDAQVFGGPNLTPPWSSRFQYLQGAVLGSVVGSGPVRRRYRKAPPGSADERFFTLCNLAVRKRAMLEFPPGLLCAEENAVLGEMSRRGLPMHYDPELVVFHERRPTRAGFAKQMMKYGRGRGQLTMRAPRTARPAYFVPAVLVAYLLALPLLASLGPAAWLPLAAYLGLVTAASLRVGISFRRWWAAAPIAAPVFVILHISYGIGCWRGLALDAHRRAPPAPRWRAAELEDLEADDVGLAVEAAE